MSLYKLEDFDSDYQDTFQGNDIKGLGVYTEVTNEKIGVISDVLVDEEGHFRYLVVDLGFWIFGKKVLLPVGRSRIDFNSDRIYAIGLTREQAEDLPEFDERRTLDYDYEETVRGVYRNPSYQTSTVDAATPLDTTATLETGTPVDTSYRTTATPTYERDAYTYENEPALYGINEQNHQILRLYEERLIANKTRRKTGEVAIGKHVETETAKVAVPIETERLVIERITPTGAGQAVSPGEADFREGEVIRVELHEETPDIRKEAVVREEIRVKKVVDHDTVEAQETIRREELDINAPGLPVEER
ncbi:DUF2382 domain-containing protein [Nostoc sp. UHCC 0702]|nr:DUF2382 domain-containing protein [Nostoc sp. UHCC 0702]